MVDTKGCFSFIVLHYGFKFSFILGDFIVYRAPDSKDVLAAYCREDHIVHFMRLTNEGYNKELYKTDSIQAIHNIFKKEGFVPKTRTEAELLKIKSDAFLSMLLDATE